ncbi:nuclear transport factor 2 family protein [uncultured Jatrophihabitans sp.]|uniref:nuclear transport factor 2 family protein n=1 Tax=uncultured Jatrophihabitans sp. TaxID=1610747 RepID=UPI0035CA77F2
MEDAIARYRLASQDNDIETLMAQLADDVELVSPLSSHAVFRGRADARLLLSAVYGSLRDFVWDEEVGDATVRVVVGHGHVGPFALSDAMVLDLGDDGRIRRIRPHLRPWLGLTWFALAVAAKLVRHPGVLVRALRG